MVQWINYALTIEVFALVLFIYGLIAFFNTIKNLNYRYQIALFLILASLALEIVQGVTIGILLYKQVVHNNPLWTIYPLVALIGAFLLVLGAKKFLSATQD